MQLRQRKGLERLRHALPCGACIPTFCDHGPHDAGAVAPVAAPADAPSDEVLPEPDAAAARVVAPASGTGASTGYTGISSAVPADAATCAPAAAVAVAYYCNGAASARASDAAACVEAEAPAASTPIDVNEDARPPPAACIPRTLPPPPPRFLNLSHPWRQTNGHEEGNNGTTVAASPNVVLWRSCITWRRRSCISL